MSLKPWCSQKPMEEVDTGVSHIPCCRLRRDVRYLLDLQDLGAGGGGERRGLLSGLLLLAPTLALALAQGPGWVLGRGARRDPRQELVPDDPDVSPNLLDVNSPQGLLWIIYTIIKGEGN